MHAAGARTTYVAAVRSRFSFVFFWLAGGLALYYVAVLDRGAFNVRYSSFVTPALYVSLAVGIVAWRRLHVYLPVLFATILLAGFALGIQADWYDEQHAREDIAGVVKWLRDHTGPNDVVLVDQKYPFGFYYDRYAIEADERAGGIGGGPGALFVCRHKRDRCAAKRLGCRRGERVLGAVVRERHGPEASGFLLAGQRRRSRGARSGSAAIRSTGGGSIRRPSLHLLPTMQQVRHQFGQAVQTSRSVAPERATRGRVRRRRSSFAGSACRAAPWIGRSRRGSRCMTGTGLESRRRTRAS